MSYPERDTLRPCHLRRSASGSRTVQVWFPVSCSFPRHATAQLIGEIQQECQMQKMLVLCRAIGVQNHCETLSIRCEGVRLKRTACFFQENLLLRPDVRRPC